jgi:hypothetical protein
MGPAGHGVKANFLAGDCGMRWGLRYPRTARTYGRSRTVLITWCGRMLTSIKITLVSRRLSVRYDQLTLCSFSPAEELNRISLRNISTRADNQKYYGYPTCYTAWDSSALTTSSPQFTFQTGSQFSIRTSPDTRDDGWCGADANNIKPILSLQAHSAPLDIVFYDAPSANSEGVSTTRQYAVNTDWDGDAFVSFHGSWNRDPATG